MLEKKSGLACEKNSRVLVSGFFSTRVSFVGKVRTRHSDHPRKTTLLFVLHAARLPSTAACPPARLPACLLQSLEGEKQKGESVCQRIRGYFFSTFFLLQEWGAWRGWEGVCVCLSLCKWL